LKLSEAKEKRMDRLAERMREDAGDIDAEVSAELDKRIHASLMSAQPGPARPAARIARAASFWWASSLTGIAAATVLIVVINLNRAAPPTEFVAAPTIPHIVVPQIDFEVDDIRKVEETVRNDMRFDF
jgi:hypothetical protein